MSDQTTVAKVDRDYLADGAEDTRVGSRWTTKEVLTYASEPVDIQDVLKSPKTRFRLKDDDGEVYYGGWLLNDDFCAVQEIVLKWGTWDAGCTTIEVKVNNEWKQEMG